MYSGPSPIHSQGYQKQVEKGPSPRPKRGKWDEASVEQDLPFIEEAIRIIETAQAATQVFQGNAIKTGLRQELEEVGWKYSSRATYRANLLVRKKYLVFESSYKQDMKNSYRVKVATSHGIVSDYKLMKWIPKINPEFEFFDLFTTKKGLLIVVIIILLLLTFPFICNLVVW